MVKKCPNNNKTKNKEMNEKKSNSNKENNALKPNTKVAFNTKFNKEKLLKKFSYLVQNSKKNSGNQEEQNKKICLNILYYDENLIASKENNEICSFLKLKNQGTFYGIHNFDLFKYICEKIKDSNKIFILICSGSSSEKIFNYISDINEFKGYYIYCYDKPKYLPLLERYPNVPCIPICDVGGWGGE